MIPVYYKPCLFYWQLLVFDNTVLFTVQNKTIEREVGYPLWDITMQVSLSDDAKLYLDSVGLSVNHISPVVEIS